MHVRFPKSLTLNCFEPAHGLSMKKPFGVGAEGLGNHAELGAGKHQTALDRAGQQHLLEGLDELTNRFGVSVSHTGDGLVVRRF